MGMFRRFVAVVFMGLALVSGATFAYAAEQGGSTSYTSIFAPMREALTPPPVNITPGGGANDPGEAYQFPGCKVKYWKRLHEEAMRAATVREAQWEAASAHTPVESSFSLFGNGTSFPCNDIYESFKNVGVFFDPSVILNSILSNACRIATDAVKKKLAEKMRDKTWAKFHKWVDKGMNYAFNPAQFFFLGLNALEKEAGVPIQMNGLRFYTVDGVYPEVNGVPLNQFDQNTIPIPDRARIIFPKVTVGGKVVSPWPRSITCTKGADCIKNPY